MLERITIDANICHGKPVISGTRILVSNIFAELAAGHSFDEIITEYPILVKEDILAALKLGAELSNFEELSYKSIAS